MRQVDLTHVATGRRYSLDAGERDSFARELARTAPWHSWSTFWAWLTGRDRYIPLGIAPDVDIVAITDLGRRREFAIYGRTVLRDKASGRNRQFYMGVVLVEWVS